jgi:predicted MFS family arabinose efflux permease
MLSVQQAVQLSLTAPLLNDWNYAPALIGLQVSALSVASLLARVPSGLLYAPSRARPIQAVCLPLLAALLVAHPFATSPLAFFVVRVLSGALYGLVTTLNLARFIDEQPLGPHRARYMGYYVACIPIGYSIASLAVGYVVEASGYVAAFVAGAAFSVLGLLAVLDRTPLVPATAPTASQPDATAPSQAEAQETSPARSASLRRLFAIPAFAVLAGETFLMNALWAFWNAWLPLYTLAVAIGLAETGLLRTIYGILNAAARFVAGDQVARFGASRLSIVSLVLQFLLLVLLPALPVLTLLLGVFAVLGALRAFGIVANTVAVVEGGEAHGVGRGPLVGLLNFVTDVGILAGPALGGLVAQAVGPVQVFVVVPLGMLAGYVVVLGCGRLAESRAAREEAQGH